MRGHSEFDVRFERPLRLTRPGRPDVLGEPGTIRVLFAESDRLVAEALMSAIDVEQSLEPIGYALDTWDLLELTESLIPDVIVVGPHVRGLDGEALTRLLNELFPCTRVVLLTAAPRAAADADGPTSYLPLDGSTEDLINAIVEAPTHPARLSLVGADDA